MGEFEARKLLRDIPILMCDQYRPSYRCHILAHLPAIVRCFSLADIEPGRPELRLAFVLPAWNFVIARNYQ